MGGVLLETSLEEAAMQMLRVSSDVARLVGNLLILESSRSAWKVSKILQSDEAQPLPGPDLGPWPPPHLSAVAMETRVML